MERYLTVNQVIGEVLSEHEEVVTAQLVANTHEEFAGSRAQAECLRHVLERITQKLPEGKQKKWRERLLKHYKTMACAISLDME
jgi:hypothetical protein